MSIGIARARPGQSDELGRRMALLIEPTSHEPGCISYDLYRSIDDDAVWIFLECWKAETDIDAHVESAHFHDFASRLDEVAEGPPQSHRAMRVAASRRVPAP